MVLVSLGPEYRYNACQASAAGTEYLGLPAIRTRMPTPCLTETSEPLLSLSVCNLRTHTKHPFKDLGPSRLVSKSGTLHRTGTPMQAAACVATAVRTTTWPTSTCPPAGAAPRS